MFPAAAGMNRRRWCGCRWGRRVELATGAPFNADTVQRDWLTRNLNGAVEIETVSLLPHQSLFFHWDSGGGKFSTLGFLRSPGRAGTGATGRASAERYLSSQGLLLVRRLG